MALAHPLRPVVQIGNAGLSAGVHQEISSNLRLHELIKVKLPKATDAATKATQEESIQSALPPGSAVVGRIGGTVVLYFRNPKDPKVALPGGKSARLTLQ